jgi:hypothetical protein
VAAAAGPGEDPKAPPKVKFGGRRLFSVSGDVKRPGVYEVAIGLTLGELFTSERYCGGLLGPLRAVAASGPSGGLIPAKLPLPPNFDDKKRADAVAKIRERSAGDADFMEWFFRTYLPPGATELDTLRIPLDLNFFRHLNGALRLPVEAMLGAAITVYAGDVDILDQAVNYTQFYRNESCGKCVPCRLGSQKLVQIGEDMLSRRNAGRPLAGDDASGSSRTWTRSPRRCN